MCDLGYRCHGELSVAVTDPTFAYLVGNVSVYLAGESVQNTRLPLRRVTTTVVAVRPVVLVQVLESARQFPREESQSCGSVVTAVVRVRLEIA